MNELSVFEHPMFGELRTTITDGNGEPWFVAKDVAEALGYKTPQKAIRDHCKGSTTVPKQNGGYLTIIPERDLYRLVMRSKLPAAEAFEEWVVGEVLPSIRKTGSYPMPQSFPEALRMLANSEEREGLDRGSRSVILDQNLF